MRPLLALVLATLAACGGTLYTSEGLPALPTVGSSCGADQVACTGASGSTCVTEDPGNCGACGNVCSGTLPAHASHACVAHQCGFACADGYLRTATGCESAAALAAGASHTCAITEASGSLRCWGGNDDGQVTGTATLGTPVAVPHDLAASGATIVAAGARHTCAVVSGAVQCWGASPALPVPPPTGVVALSAGAFHTCAIANGAARDVRCWGTGAAASAPTIAGATAITSGASHACALLSSGGVTCWGDNSSGQLGNGSLAGASGTPFTAGIASIAAGGNHTCAALSSPVRNGNVSDSIECWGDAPGTPFLLAASQVSPAIPMRDANQSTIRFPVSLAVAGRTHTCVTNATEGLNCFGPDNALGQLGGVPAPATDSLVVTGDAAVLAAGGDHSCARYSIDGTLRCWGANGSGQLGNGTTVQPSTGTIVPVSGR